MENAASFFPLGETDEKAARRKLMASSDRSGSN
jgi:hypothetical protein